MNAPFYYLSSAQSALEPALTLGQGLPRTMEIAGKTVPVGYFWGRGAKLGAIYIHPTKKWQLSVTPASVKDWVDNFRSMAKNGVKVPIVQEDHDVKASKTLGYMVDCRIHDGWFEPMLQMIGQDAIAMASRNEISLGVKEQIVDGAGHTYDDAIEHVAITPLPVVPGQNGLRAASNTTKPDSVPVFSLSGTPEKVSPIMDVEDMNCALDQSDLDYLKTCSMDDGMDMSKVTPKTAFKALRTAHEKLMSKLKKNMSRISELEPLEAKVKPLEEQVKTLSATQVRTLDPEIVFERRQRVAGYVENLVQNGYSKADADEIALALAGTTEQPNLKLLSRTGNGDCDAIEVLKILARCKPAPKPGESTFLMGRTQDSSHPTNTANDPKAAVAWWTGQAAKA